MCVGGRGRGGGGGRSESGWLRGGRERRKEVKEEEFLKQSFITEEKFE